MADPEGRVDAAELVLDDRFAMVPEWGLDAEISDCAVRLYAVLLRYGYSTGARMPGRATLARRLHKTSTDTVERALKELVALGAVTVEHRFETRGSCSGDGWWSWAHGDSNAPRRSCAGPRASQERFAPLSRLHGSQSS